MLHTMQASMFWHYKNRNLSIGQYILEKYTDIWIYNKQKVTCYSIGGHKHYHICAQQAGWPRCCRGKTWTLNGTYCTIPPDTLLLTNIQISDCGRIEVIVLEKRGADLFRGSFNFKVQDIYVQQHKHGYLHYFRACFSCCYSTPSQEMTNPIV